MKLAGTIFYHIKRHYGPQYRVGSHRQFVKLSRALAAQLLHARMGSCQPHARQQHDSDESHHRHQAHRKADEERSQSAQRGIAKCCRDGHEGEHHEREIFTRAKDQRQLDDGGREEGQQQRGDQPRDERADGELGDAGNAMAGCAAIRDPRAEL